tara:strand:+ start:11746 stop:12315 length:570 start_codon:yes stop_codon:yes gene_type:complete
MENKVIKSLNEEANEEHTNEVGDNVVKNKDISNNLLKNAVVENFIKEQENENWSEEHKNIIRYVCFKTNMHPKNALETLRLYNGDYKKIIRIHKENKLIDIVMRQTTYDKDTAYLKLKEENGDFQQVIKKYLGFKENKTQDNRSTNQKIFYEIRNFMDNSKKEKDKLDNKNIQDKFISDLTQKTINKIN